MGKIFIKDDLIDISLKARNQEEIFKKMGSLMIKKGYAKDGYIEGLIKRENEFPTGLVSVDGIGIAIPHTDARYVNNSAIAVGVLEEVVPFEIMGGMENDLVDVEIVFLLAVNNSSEQLNILQNLISMFQKKGALKKIKEAKEEKQVVNILKEELIK